MIKLIFIRHGATEGNLHHRYIGRTDEALCKLGVAQVEKLLQYHLHAEYIIVSPTLRTKQTAQILFPGKDQMYVEDLKETNFGIFEGKNAEDLCGCAEYRVWVDSGCVDQIPGGESVPDFKKRCCRAFMTVLHGIPDGASVAFVVHGGVIMAILEAFARPLRNFYEYHIGNGEYVMCQFEDGMIFLDDQDRWSR